MSNPVRGVYLGGRFYDYVPASFRETINFKNTGSDTYSSRTFSVLGLAPSTYTMTLALDTHYDVQDGELIIGNTSWLGVSRLADLKSFLGAPGVSLPVLLVTPYGETVNVAPIGSLDVEIFNPDNPGTSSGVEFRVNLTLQET